MKEKRYAVKLHNIITNLSYECQGQTKWCKAIFDTEEQAKERCDYMNELDQHDYTVVPVTVAETVAQKV